MCTVYTVPQVMNIQIRRCFFFFLRSAGASRAAPMCIVAFVVDVPFSLPWRFYITDRAIFHFSSRFCARLCLDLIDVRMWLRTMHY